MKLVQAYAPISSQDDEEIEQFYKEIELAMRKAPTQYTVVMGDFNTKVGEKQVAEQAIGNYDINSRNIRGQMLVQFAESNMLRIMIRIRSNRKWPAKALM